MGRTLESVRITIEIGDDILLRVEERAKKEGRDLNSVIEEALSLYLERRTTGQRRHVELPASDASGGLLPGIDVNRSSDLDEQMDGA